MLFFKSNILDISLNKNEIESSRNPKIVGTTNYYIIILKCTIVIGFFHHYYRKWLFSVGGSVYQMSAAKKARKLDQAPKTVRLAANLME